MALRDTLRKQMENAEEDQRRAQQRVLNWQNAVKALYTEVGIWFDEYVHDGLLKITKEDVLRNEELSGPYNIVQFYLEFSTFRAQFIPVATYIFGAQGRVDLAIPGYRAAAAVLLLPSIDHPKQWTFSEPGQKERFVLTKAILEDYFDKMIAR